MGYGDQHRLRLSALLAEGLERVPDALKPLVHGVQLLPPANQTFVHRRPLLVCSLRQRLYRLQIGPQPGEIIRRSIHRRLKLLVDIGGCLLPQVREGCLRLSQLLTRRRQGSIRGSQFARQFALQARGPRSAIHHVQRRAEQTRPADDPPARPALLGRAGSVFGLLRARLLLPLELGSLALARQFLRRIALHKVAGIRRCRRARGTPAEHFDDPIHRRVYDGIRAPAAKQIPHPR